ncbi:hypothetical protein CWATWH0402_819 [Crocosphaera watsonii WH 0402]|uniref:Uncharacterized protein n=2 Tax=Crocosphaera watsonii TaxID=263511 RepID=T2JT49_CROWT|nr:hypothetical protein CWATWH0003_4271 [Crocosphaera watsonii WH 0003]CCQ68231.1 hypothetical protein CWATWH0402_819 [Crocosphaera watsonii WH 0402]
MKIIVVLNSHLATSLKLANLQREQGTELILPMDNCQLSIIHYPLVRLI